MHTQEHDEHDARASNIDRRSLLGGGLVGLTTLVVGCGSSTPSGGDFGPTDAAPPETGPDPDASPMDAAEACAPVQCTDDANTLVVDVTKHPGLAKKGGSVTLTDSRYVDPFCGQSQVIVAQPTADKFIALSASCTHSCCLVSFTGQGFFCPCHGSTFDLTGKVTGGPANGPLAQVPLCADGCGKLYLTLK